MAAQEQDGRDISTAEPPFAVLQLVLPPKPSPARRTPKITADPVKQSSPQPSPVARCLDDMSIPEQRSAWQDNGQYADPDFAGQGHPAFPEGVIQAALDMTPSPSPPTGLVRTSTGKQPVTGSLSLPLPRPRSQMQQQGTPVSHSTAGLCPSHRSFAGSRPSVRGPRYEPHMHERPAYGSSVPIRPHTQQGPSASSMPAVRDDTGFRPAVQQSFLTIRPAAMQSGTNIDSEACNSMTPVARAAAEAARRPSHDLMRGGVFDSPGIKKNMSHAFISCCAVLCSCC